MEGQVHLDVPPPRQDEVPDGAALWLRECPPAPEHLAALPPAAPLPSPLVPKVPVQVNSSAASKLGVGAVLPPEAILGPAVLVPGQGQYGDAVPSLPIGVG